MTPKYFLTIRRVGTNFSNTLSAFYLIYEKMGGEMLSGVFIVIGVCLLIFGPIPVGIPWFNQILGLILIVGGPWLVRRFCG
jgi:uncharacterized membrane protein YjgN (DUF898 family)